MNWNKYLQLFFKLNYGSCNVIYHIPVFPTSSNFLRAKKQGYVKLDESA